MSAIATKGQNPAVNFAPRISAVDFPSHMDIDTVAAGRSSGVYIIGAYRGTIAFGDTTLVGPPDDGTLSPVFATYISDPQTAQPPRLQISRASDEIALTWSATPSGFALEGAASLSSPVTWLPVATAPIFTGDQSSVTLRISRAAQFFRLKKQ